MKPDTLTNPRTKVFAAYGATLVYSSLFDSSRAIADKSSVQINIQYSGHFCCEVKAKIQDKHSEMKISLIASSISFDEKKKKEKEKKKKSIYLICKG